MSKRWWWGWVGVSLMSLLVATWAITAEPPDGRGKRAREQETKDVDSGKMTHQVRQLTEYYVDGPQQMRPPDGRFAEGTPVQVLEKRGSYWLVRSKLGVTAYVAAGTLEELGAESGKPVDLAAAKGVAQSNNKVAWDLYQQLSSERPHKNLFFSPASIATALAMVYGGAEQDTAAEMAQVLHLDESRSQVHPGFGALGRILNSRSEGYQLSMANRLWGREGYPFRPEYLELTRNTYDAELASLDFAQSEKARSTINEWVSEQTSGKIEQLLSRGVITSNTRLVVTNAIYFKGQWTEKFQKSLTEPAPFHLSADRNVEVPMMHQSDRFRYAQLEGAQLLEMTYGQDERLAMVILLPDEIDGLGDLEERLSAEQFDQWLEQAHSEEVQVYLPQFQLSTEFQMGDTLTTMGMQTAFTGRANFHGISTAEDLFISDVIHKAYVDVNEEGTEAAAATGVVLAPTAALPEGEPIVFRADRPFMFLIRDSQTGAILFLGRLLDPKA